MPQPQPQPQPGSARYCEHTDPAHLVLAFDAGPQERALCGADGAKTDLAGFLRDGEFDIAGNPMPVCEDCKAVHAASAGLDPFGLVDKVAELLALTSPQERSLAAEMIRDHAEVIEARVRDWDKVGLLPPPLGAPPVLLVEVARDIAALGRMGIEMGEDDNDGDDTPCGPDCGSDYHLCYDIDDDGMVDLDADDDFFGGDWD